MTYQDNTWGRSYQTHLVLSGEEFNLARQGVLCCTYRVGRLNLLLGYLDFHHDVERVGITVKSLEILHCRQGDIPARYYSQFSPTVTRSFLDRRKFAREREQEVTVVYWERPQTPDLETRMAFVRGMYTPEDIREICDGC